MTHRLSTLAGLIGLSLLTTACGDVNNPGEDNEGEVITTVELTFTPDGGGTAITASWADPEDDGSPVIDDITLADATTYALSVRFLNELEDPAEDITEEVAEEDDEHQVFFTGTAVDGPAGTGSAAVVTHAYDDEDGDGAPIGLDSTISTTGAGSGSFIVTLQHLPPEDGSPVKTATLADEVASGGLSALPGEADASVTFTLTVE